MMKLIKIQLLQTFPGSYTIRQRNGVSNPGVSDSEARILNHQNLEENGSHSFPLNWKRSPISVTSWP